MDSADFEIQDGSILIAAITSCTNTSNPNVLIGAGFILFGIALTNLFKPKVLSRDA